MYYFPKEYRSPWWKQTILWIRLIFYGIIFVAFVVAKFFGMHI